MMVSFLDFFPSDVLTSKKCCGPLASIVRSIGCQCAISPFHLQRERALCRSEPSATQRPPRTLEGPQRNSGGNCIMVQMNEQCKFAVNLCVERFCSSFFFQFSKRTPNLFPNIIGSSNYGRGK